MTKPIAIYVRVSTRLQDTASQEPDLKKWIQTHGAEAKWYRDTFTGTTMDRPGFLRLMRDVHAGKVATIVVWRLDRLGRTAKGLTALFEDLTARKINLVSLRDGLDLTTAAGRLMANVLASVAAYETEVRSERVVAGQLAARAAGKTWGGSLPGRRVVAGQLAARAAGKTWGGSLPGRRLKVTPEQQGVIRRMKSEGISVAAIGRATGLSRPTVYSVLQAAEPPPAPPKRRRGSGRPGSPTS
jgi:DNA invertase Pin-like site-specific DNA recombinase